MQKIKILAICGKSGTGKDTLLKRLLQSAPEALHEIVSYTTRPPREGEVDGKNYHFVSIEEFTKMLLDGSFLEAAEFNDWHYGTSLESLDPDKINIGVFNPDGIEALHNDPRVEVRVIYLSVPDKERLIRQLSREKAPDIEEILRRYRTDKQDFDFFNTWAHEELYMVNFRNKNEQDLKHIVSCILSELGQL